MRFVPFSIAALTCVLLPGNELRLTASSCGENTCIDSVENDNLIHEFGCASLSQPVFLEEL